MYAPAPAPKTKKTIDQCLSEFHGCMMTSTLAPAPAPSAAADPCAGLTDTSLASSVSPACLQKIWKDNGCSEKGAAYPPSNYTGWWTQSPNGAATVWCDATNSGTQCGAGTFAAIKNDIKFWSTATAPERVAGCKGAAAPTTSSTATWVKPGYNMINTANLPAKFKLKNAATNQYWNGDGQKLGEDGTGTPLVISASSPADIYKVAGTDMVALNTQFGAVRHAGFIMWTNPYTANNFDFAWKLLLKDGTTDRVIIWNAYPGNGTGMYVTGGSRPKIDAGPPTEYIIEPVTASVAPTTLTGKMVRVERADGKNEYIILLGIDVFDANGAKITAGVTPIGAPIIRGDTANSGPQFLLNGPQVEGAAGAKVAHTEATPNAYLGLDLGSDNAISKIVIYNRTSCCMDRINGCVLKVINAAGATIVTIPLSGSKAVYTFSAPLTNSSTSSTYMMEGSPFVLSGYGGPGPNWKLILSLLVLAIMLWILAKKM